MSMLVLAGVLCAGSLGPAAIRGETAAAAESIAASPLRSCPPGGDRTAKSSAPQEKPSLHYLTDVRVAGHRCADRVVFEFEPNRGGAPGFLVEYQRERVKEEGRGQPVETAGEAVVAVRMSRVRDVRLSSEHPEPTYRGPDTIRPQGTRHVVEIRHVSSFEGNVTWAVGLRDRRPFQVKIVPSPPRLVVDFG